MSLRVSAPCSTISQTALALSHERTLETKIARELVYAQPYLSTVRKMPRAAVRVLNADKNLKRESTAYGGYCTFVADVRNWRNRRNCR